MRRYKYIGRDGSSRYRTGKHYWGFLSYTVGEGGHLWRISFIPVNKKRVTIHYSDYERFKADWE